MASSSAASESKVVFVTGCSKGGIGFSLCEAFAAQGCIVYASARRVKAMEGFKHAGIHRIALDVNNAEDTKTAIQSIIDSEGRIDIVVNNAGVICIGPIIDVSEDQVKRTFETNFFAPLRIAHEVIPHMAKRKQGLIINVGSVVGELPTPWNGIYSTTKSALHTLTEVLSMECKPFNINVMLLIPGSVQSNISSNHLQIFNLPQTTLYKPYLDQIVRRLHMSQDPSNSMPTDEFAKIVVKKALSKAPPLFLRLGGNVALVTLLSWFPRGLALWFVWKKFTKK